MLLLLLVLKLKVNNLKYRRENKYAKINRLLSLKRKILLIFYIANSEWHGILKQNLSMRNGNVLKYDILNSNVQKTLVVRSFGKTI